MEHDILKGAYDNDHGEVSAALAESPACINAQSQAEGLTALHIAAALGNQSMVELLLKQPLVDVTVKDRFGRDPLDIAITTGHPAVIKALFARTSETIGPDRAVTRLGANVVLFPK